MSSDQEGIGLRHEGRLSDGLIGSKAAMDACTAIMMLMVLVPTASLL